MKNEFKSGDLAYHVNHRDGIVLTTISERAFRGKTFLVDSDEDWEAFTEYGFLWEGYALPSLHPATEETYQLLVSLYGEDAVPKLPDTSQLDKKI